MGQEQSAPTTHPRSPERRNRKGKGRKDIYRSDGKKRVREESFEHDTLEEALDLMSENDFQNLAHKKARFIKGALSWARLADGASRTIACPRLCCLQGRRACRGGYLNLSDARSISFHISYF